MQIILGALLVACCGAVAQAVIPVAPYGYPRPLGVPVAAAPYAYGRPAGLQVAFPGAFAGPGYPAAPAVAKVAARVEDYDPNPQYSYAYDIKDALTGDAKSHHETRSGDVVQGSYSVVEPDGTRRIVEYVADPHNGFNAVVHKEPATHVVKAAPVVGHVAPAYVH